VLLAALEEPERTAHETAWTLAMLYNLTGLLDPTNYRGVLGAYQTIMQWRETGGGGMILAGSGSGDGGGVLAHP
jgi:hypothetical protein